MKQLLPIFKLFWLIVSFLASSIAYGFPPLQLYIELTPEGGTLNAPAGVYSGPIVLKRPITIDGKGGIKLDGGGDGTVVTILADNVTVKGLHITNSGGSHDSVDAGVSIKGDNALVENNVLDEVLFGISMSGTNNSIVRNNTVSSLERDISLRGDGIRLWYSHDNLIEKNILTRVRDMAVNNSSDNRVIGNIIKDSRIGMEFVFSPQNEIAENTITNNITGIVVIYSNEMDIHDNRLSHMRKLTGAGFSLKESAEVMLTNNEVAHCAVGLQANSPLDPENKMIADGNLFTYNVLGVYFYGEKGGHVLRNNRFENNFTDALGSAPMAVRMNVWENNYWDNYQGFDKDGDGIGDKPHDVYLFSERLWVDSPKLKFFRASPAMEVIDLSFRLAPFTRPALQYSDPSPRMTANH